MCTAISYRKSNHYFGRNLDVEFTFQEKVVITPRNYLFRLKNGSEFKNSYALIGVAAVLEDYPLYYEAANEAGLAMAGLNFPGNAVYQSPCEGKDNITAFELIPWILGQARTVDDAQALLEKLNLTSLTFNEHMPTSPLHFMISDRERSIVAEPMADGLHIYENPFDVMTNNPPFDYHLWNMNNYLNLTPEDAKSRFSKEYPLTSYGVGMGALGLPGDTSSASRFVRAAFNLTNSSCGETEAENVSQFFHVLDSVAMLKGSTLTAKGENDITLYSCCINTDTGVFYYKTYNNNQITAVRLNEENKSSDSLTVFGLNWEQNIKYEN